MSTYAMDEGIRYLDGHRFKLGVIAGARHLIAHRRHLDHINVFPVPDSDTGTNMAASARHLIDVTIGVEAKSVRRAADAVADAALFGGRGNSGAILAQFFQGFAEGLGQRSRALVHDFAGAAIRAAASAKDAVSEPREGTILTVMADWAEAIMTSAREGAGFVRALQEGHRTAKQSLARTPDLLPVLREAHVVDAGAQGFVYLLEGVASLIEKGLSNGEIVIREEDEEDTHADDSLEKSAFRWCTECVVDGDDLPRETIRHMLESMGDSVVLAGSAKRMRIHVHTDHPGPLIERLREWGEVTREKADDMHQQWRHAHHPPEQRVAIVTDTASDLPDEILLGRNIHEIPFRVFFGDNEYIDKVTLDKETFYARLSSDPDHPKTTQPAPADFIRAYELVAKHYDAVLSVHIPRKLSGTLQSAEKAAKVVSSKIRVIDSKAGTVGLGLVVLEAARAAGEGRDIEVVERIVRSAIDRTTTLIQLEDTEYLLKGGRIGRTKAFFGRLLNMRLILAGDDEGDLVILSRIVGGRDPEPLMMRHVERALGGKPPERLAVSHADAPEKARRYVDRLRERYGEIDVLVGEFSPALGSHTGPGAVGIGILRSD